MTAATIYPLTLDTKPSAPPISELESGSLNGRRVHLLNTLKAMCRTHDAQPMKYLEPLVFIAALSAAIFTMMAVGAAGFPILGMVAGFCMYHSCYSGLKALADHYRNHDYRNAADALEEGHPFRVFVVEHQVPLTQDNVIQVFKSFEKQQMELLGFTTKANHE